MHHLTPRSALTPPELQKQRIAGLSRNHFISAMVLAVLACLALSGCAARQNAQSVQVLVDGAPWKSSDGVAGQGGDLRVYVTLDGEALIDMPFGEAHTVDILQSDGAENTFELTGEAVRMSAANCENQDCVHMGDVTRDNLELRVMGGFIICLPHRLSVEVRGD